jgi:hypothetical protein
MLKRRAQFSSLTPKINQNPLKTEMIIIQYKKTLKSFVIKLKFESFHLQLVGS